MRLEWWSLDWKNVTYSMVKESDVYTAPEGKKGKILLVESAAELELAQALQFIYGQECLIEIAERTSLPDVSAYRGRFSRVYTSWDPLDSQR